MISCGLYPRLGVGGDGLLGLLEISGSEVVHLVIVVFPLRGRFLAPAFYGSMTVRLSNPFTTAATRLSFSFLNAKSIVQATMSLKDHCSNHKQSQTDFKLHVRSLEMLFVLVID